VKEEKFAKADGIKARCYWELFGGRNLGTLCFDFPPQQERKACMESRESTVQVESEQWTVNSPHQTQFEKRTSLPLHPPKRK